MTRPDGVTILAIIFMAAIMLDSGFDWFWQLAHRRDEPLSPDDRKHFWKIAISALIAIVIVGSAGAGILAALGLHVWRPLDIIATGIIIAAGTDKLAQLAAFLKPHEAAPMVQVVSADQLTYSVTGEMTILNQ